MTHRLAANYTKNYCNLTPIVKVIVENVVTCFLGTQCILFESNHVCQKFSILCSLYGSWLGKYGLTFSSRFIV